MRSRSRPSPACRSPPPRRSSTGCSVEVEALERDAGESHDLRGESIDDLRGDGIVGGGREDHWWKLLETAHRDGAAVDLLCQLEWGADPEVGRDEAFERRGRPAPVLASRSGRGGCEADVEAPSPVARGRAERREAGMPAVGRHSDAVDSRAAHDGDTPAALRPCAEDREGVVPDEDLIGPAACRDGGADLVLFGREVDPRHQECGDVRDPPLRRAAERLFDQLRDDLHRALDADVVGRARRAAREAEHVPLGRDDRDVRLRVATVDCERVLHAAVSTRVGR